MQRDSHTTPPPPCGDDTSRNGVALLIVLGLLAVMMLSAVAFSISMRIERAGAANMRHATTANHMLETAATRAMSQIDAQCANQLFPPWEAITSYNAIDTNIHAQVLSAEAMRFVPGVLRDTAESLTPHWVPIEADGRTIGRCAYIVLNLSDMLDANFVGGALRGLGESPAELQLAHLPVFDVDENQSPLPSLIVDNFAAARLGHGSYETLPEFRSLQLATFGAVAPTYDNGEWFDSIDRNRGDRVSRFTTYSRYEHTPATNSAGAFIEALALPRALADIETQAAAIQSKLLTMLRASTPLSDADHAAAVYEQLLDYLDADSVPRSLDLPSVERVPMINEFRVSPNARLDILQSPVAGAPTTIELFLSPTVELIYPFNEKADGEYTVRLECWYQNTAKVETHAQNSGTGSPFWETKPISKATFGANAYAAPGPFTGYSTYSFYAGGGKALDTGPFDAIRLTDVEPNKLLQVSAYFRVSVIDQDGNVVDAAPAKPYSPNDSTDPPIRLFWYYLECNVPAFPPAGEALAPITMDILPDFTGNAGAYEAVDPRINSETDGSLGKMCNWVRRPTAAEHSFKEVNLATLTYVNDPKNVQRDRDAKHPVPQMYCSNLEELRSVGELANLIRSTVKSRDNDYAGYFQTIRLYDRQGARRFDRDPVFEYFRLETEPPASNVRQGLVNINSPDVDLLQTALREAPLSFAPDTTERVPLERAEALADAILANTYPAGGGVDFLRSMSEYGDLDKFDWRQIMPEAAGYSDLQAEALMASTANLFGIRQNLFLVIMRADSFTARFGMTGIKRGQVRSSAHGVALVWRDPIGEPDPDNPGKFLYYPMFRRAMLRLSN